MWLSLRPSFGRVLLHGHDHPRHAETIRHHAEARGEECLGERHLDLAAFLQIQENATVSPGFVYKSRADRDRVNKKVMSDKRLAGMMDIKSLPFDAKRIIYGGCKVLVEA
jgi:uncharacterized protein YbaA (DUF1428 family)